GSLLRIGSTAEAVIVKTRVPVLVLRDPAPWLEFARGERKLRVLLGIDDSVACELCIQWTLALRARGPVDVVLGAIYYPDAAIETLRVPVVQSALVATDLSAFANRAVPFAYGLTPEAGDVHLVHIVKPDEEYDETEVTRALFALAPKGMSRKLSAHVVRGDD